MNGLANYDWTRTAVPITNNQQFDICGKALFSASAILGYDFFIYVPWKTVNALHLCKCALVSVRWMQEWHELSKKEMQLFSSCGLLIIERVSDVAKWKIAISFLEFACTC